MNQDVMLTFRGPAGPVAAVRYIAQSDENNAALCKYLIDSIQHNHIAVWFLLNAFGPNEVVESFNRDTMRVEDYPFIVLQPVGSWDEGEETGKRLTFHPFDPMQKGQTHTINVFGEIRTRNGDTSIEAIASQLGSHSVLYFTESAAVSFPLSLSIITMLHIQRWTLVDFDTGEAWES